MKAEDISAWVKQAPNQDQRELREAVHTLLKAISLSPSLKSRMLLKGGILMALRFNSTRFTRDVDFSTKNRPNEEDPENLVKELSKSLALAVETLDYDLDCRIQRKQLNPERDDATFPTLTISIGYARKGSRKHTRMLGGMCPTVLKVDHSFFEENLEIAELNLDDGTVRTYSLADLVAEKYRAILQQKVRNRTRRQDVYDIYWLLEGAHLAREAMPPGNVLAALLRKAESRDLEVNAGSLRDPEIVRRSQSEYAQLRDEISGDLPPFDRAYEAVRDYYESLPWS